jgi:hypothetical protein
MTNDHHDDADWFGGTDTPFHPASGRICCSKTEEPFFQLEMV